MSLNEQVRKIRQQIEVCQAQINDNKDKIKNLRERNHKIRCKIKDLKEERRTLIFKSVGVERVKHEE